MFDVAGKVALVTGGVGGIGLGIVKELLRNGVKGVAILDVNETLAPAALEDICYEFGEKKVIFLKVDVSNRKQFEEAFRETVERFKQLDIVVNNAGILNECEWDREIEVNLLGTANGTILAFENYLPKNKNGEGVILNIASISGFRCHASLPVYAATKSGIITLTRSLGHQAHYKEKNIRVMALCPGYVHTNLGCALLGPSYLSIQHSYDFNPTPVAQLPEQIGIAAMKIIKQGQNGSLWVSEDNEPLHEIEISVAKKQSWLEGGECRKGNSEGDYGR